jgi:hypothetical protein
LYSIVQGVIRLFFSRVCPVYIEDTKCQPDGLVPASSGAPRRFHRLPPPHRSREAFQVSRGSGQPHREVSMKRSGEPLHGRSFPNEPSTPRFPALRDPSPPHPPRATGTSTPPNPAKSASPPLLPLRTSIPLRPNIPQTHNNIHRQRLAIAHLHCRRRRQPARHCASQRPGDGRRVRRFLRLQHVPRHRGRRGHVRQDGGAERRRERYAGSGVWTHGDESAGVSGVHE